MTTWKTVRRVLGSAETAPLLGRDTRGGRFFFGGTL